MHFERGREPMTALRYYAEATEAALLHFSAAEGMSLTERGLILLDRAPAGTDRDGLEISLATLRGVSAFQLLGVGAETRSALLRAYALLRDVPQHPLRGLLTHGCAFVHCLRAEYPEALAIGEQALLSRLRPVLLLGACTVQGQVHMQQGRPLAARAWLERGLPALDGLDAVAGETFVADPKAMLLGLLGIQLLHLGFVQQARARMQQAYARAAQLRQPVAGLIAIWFDALLEVRLGNAERVAALADEMRRLSKGSRSRRAKSHGSGFVAGRTLEWDNRARAIGGFEKPTRKTLS